MDKSQVEALLGKPDDIQREENEKSLTETWWRYGIDASDSDPTLGSVGFDKAGKVDNYRLGYPDYKAPPDGALTEQELRHLMRVVGGYQRGHFNGVSMVSFSPLSLVRAVNALLPYGKRKILIAIEEYQWLHQDEDAIPVLLLALFEVPREIGYLPRLTYEEAQPSTPYEKKRVPRFPLVIIDDVPLMTASPPMWQGMSIVKRIPMTDYFRVHCRLRSRPLVPSNHPFEVLEKYLASSQNLRRRPDPEKRNAIVPAHPQIIEDFRRQILWLVETAYPQLAYTDLFGPGSIKRITDADWERMKKEFAALNCHWDQSRNEYVKAE